MSDFETARRRRERARLSEPIYLPKQRLTIRELIQIRGMWFVELTAFCLFLSTIAIWVMVVYVLLS
jgi:hypothetical protein